MVAMGTKTAADAARLFNVHPATVSRLLVIRLLRARYPGLFRRLLQGN
jgi:hypothetical protein